MNEISKKQKVVLLTDGIELWMDEEKADVLIEQIKGLAYDDIIDWDGRQFTKSMYRGTFMPADVEDRTNRKNGRYKCKKNVWHERYSRCECNMQPSYMKPFDTKDL